MSTDEAGNAPDPEDAVGSDQLAAGGGSRGSEVVSTFPWTLRRIHAIQSIRPIGSYLEIGLGDGVNYRSVQVDQKFGVDPTPWNPDILSEPSVYAETSDAFFAARAADLLGTLDLIYIDGLHTAEQTYRDFVNSLDYSHDDTVWLIDDVVPHDFFSSLPDQATALAARQAATGSMDAAWHGDVYKVVWLIAQFHPSIDFVTIVGSGNSQLLAWKAKRDWQTPSMSLQELASLGYADVVLRFADFRPCDEVSAMQQLVLASTPRPDN